MTGAFDESSDMDLRDYLSHIVLLDRLESNNVSLNMSTNFEEMMKSSDFLESIRTSTDISKGELMLMALKYCFVHSLSNTALADLFQLINTIVGFSVLPIWPLYLMINELPRQVRTSKLITCGLWFHKNKPNMTVFLNMLIDMIEPLTRDGLSCTINEEVRLLKLHIIACCVDSVARASIQGIKQFNGNYGCSWCLHPGVWHESMKYPLLTSVVRPRDHISTIEDMLIVTPRRPINGVKYPSPLINLPYFNIISGFMPDYIHCALEGVAKQITEYHLSLMSSDDIKEIDIKVHGISAPHQIGRLSRPISSRNDWKAREWENYVLYYSTAVLPDHLNRKLFHHWLLFVESMYILLQDRITIDELDTADAMLHQFVAQTEEYFGIDALTFNVHQMLHICKSTLNWGPLWSHSTFSFESGNHNLIKAIKCTKGVTLQIVRYVNMIHTLGVLEESVYPHVSETIKIFCGRLYSEVQKYLQISDITYFGRGDPINELILNNLELSKSAKAFYKIIKDNCLYESSSRLKKRSNNSFVQLIDGTFAQIKVFIADKVNKKQLTLCSIVHVKDYLQNCKHIKQIENIEETTTVIHTAEIKTICVFMHVLQTMYISPVPNLLHY